MRTPPDHSAARSESAGPRGLEIPVRGLGLEALDAFLCSDRSPPDCLQLSELDGLLTGVAVGPEIIMPSEWMAAVWGGEDPVFAGEQETQAVLGGMMSRYNEIVRQVAEDAFQPLLWEGVDGVPDAADWAEGFALAMSLRPDAWGPLARAKRHAILLLPIVALCSDESSLAELGFDLAADPDFPRGIAEIIPACVLGIDGFWRIRRGRRTRGGGPSEAARTSKPGRNDPCPCGSGQKFKRCCGQ